MTGSTPIVAWGLRTTMPRSTWHFYYRFMLVENYLIAGKSDMRTGSVVYSVTTYGSSRKAQEGALKLTEQAEKVGYTLVEEPLHNLIDLDVREWMTEIIGHRDNHQILQQTYQHIRDLGQPLT